VGKVYLQTVLDCFSRYAWARLYTSKLPITAVHVLNTDVLPFFEQQQVKIRTGDIVKSCGSGLIRRLPFAGFDPAARPALRP
jgi:hypothetical protein